ncbi:MAG: hypothetical protein CMH57_07490 [Myxococcales bacterium]|nr:hypothetical protein [Myxococcales bacterium]
MTTSPRPPTPRPLGTLGALVGLGAIYALSAWLLYDSDLIARLLSLQGGFLELLAACLFLLIRLTLIVVGPGLAVAAVVALGVQAWAREGP